MRTAISPRLATRTLENIVNLNRTEFLKQYHLIDVGHIATYHICVEP